MGGSVSAGTDNDELIDNLIEANYIRTPSVEKVFRAVDRAFYFLPEFRFAAYRDLAWKRGNLHLSAPCIYSEVLEHLQLEPGRSFLNIGSGTGYLSTMAGLILGPYGVNHGIEIQPDVVNYANERLEQFVKKCNGLDMFEFCEPYFVVGNGFDLSHDRKYDRIYCGAECPQTHHEHIKRYLKVNGILIVPCEENLLKIVRTSETDWEVTSVLSVSFTTLQSPEKLSKTISLPDPQPLSLQELCRSKIRCILRSIVECENPNLLEKPKRNSTSQDATRRTRTRANLRNGIDEIRRRGRSDLGNVIFHNYNSASLLYDFMRNLRQTNANENSRQIVLALTDSESSSSESENEHDSTFSSKDPQSIPSPPSQPSVPSPIQLSPQNENEIGEVEFVSSDDDDDDGEGNPDSESDSEETSSENKGPQDLFRLPTLEGYLSDGVDADENEPQPQSSKESNQNVRKQTDEDSDDQPKKLLKRDKLDSGISEESDDGKVSRSYESSFSGSYFSEPMEVESDDSDTNRSREENTDEKTAENDIEEGQRQDLKTRPYKYRILIEEKIRCLPLPERVKIYLNHEREFVVEKC